MWTRRTVTGAVIVAMLGGLLMSGGAPVSTAQQAPPGPPHRIGYVSRDTTGLFRATGEGSAPVLPAALSDVDSSPSAGGTLPGLVWVSKRGGARQGNLFYLRDGGDKPVQLTTDDSVDEHPALSPDGRTVAYVSERSGNRDIWVIGVDGKGQRQLTDSPAADSWPTWSPDGGTLAFSSTRDDPLGDLYTVPFTGGAQVRITNDPAADTQPAWGPGRIAFTTTRFHPAGDVVTMAVTGGLVLRAVPDQGDSSEPAWTPSGGLVFTRHSADPAGDVLQVVNGQVTTVAARSRVGEFGATVRRNGEILFTQLQSGNSDDIWSSDAAGGDRRDLTNRPGADEEDPAFSPDGAFLAYTEFPSEGSASRVMVAASDGRGPRPLTGVTPSGSSHERQPAWAPDGAMIA